MNKLTCEQRDYLITLALSFGDYGGWNPEREKQLFIDRLARILDQCTEQELTHEEVLKWALAERLCKETNDADNSSREELK